MAKRCYEDAYAWNKNDGTLSVNVNNEKTNGRDYIYLIDEKNKKYHRIVDLFTLDKLGYPKPSRSNQESFHINELKLGGEIKIYNIFSEIEVIRNLAKK